VYTSRHIPEFRQERRLPGAAPDGAKYQSSPKTMNIAFLTG